MAQLEEQRSYDPAGRLREHYWTRAGQREGLALRYDATGWLLRRATYRAGQLHGSELVYGPPGAALCHLAPTLADQLAAGAVPAALRQALAAQRIALTDDARLVMVEPAGEYQLNQPGQCYTLRRMTDSLLVMPARLLRAARYRDGWLMARVHCQGGRCEGEHVRYRLPGAPLLQLDPALRMALEAADSAALQPVFAHAGQPLAAATITTEQPGVEWRISQPGQIFSVRQLGDRLLVFAGRVARRASYTGGWLIQSECYRDGLLAGDLCVYRPAAQPLAQLDPAARALLARGDVTALAALLAPAGLTIAAAATIAVVEPEREWLIAQAGPCYTIRYGADGLTVLPGRLVSRSRYQAGQLAGPTWLYNEQGMLAQTLSYRAGQLDGPLTSYAGTQPQTQISFAQGLRHGPLIAYDAQGQVSMQGSYQHGLLDGELALIQAGQIRARVSYQQGRQSGCTITYHANGRESMVANYQDDLREGISDLYTVDGQLVQRASYRAGQLHGDQLDFYADGTLRQRAHYRDGKLDGLVYRYGPHGQLQARQHYQAGHPVGAPEHPSWLQKLLQQ